MTSSSDYAHRWFTWSEFSSRGVAVPHGARSGVLALVDLLLVPLRWEFGRCRITSGYRTLAHNKDVGGAMDSRHLYANHPRSPAVDVTFAQGTPADWAASADRHLRGGGGIGVYRTHVHLDRRASRGRWSG